MAFETLRWIEALYQQASKNGSQSIQWTTPNQDKIHLSKNKIDVIELRTTYLGKLRSVSVKARDLTTKQWRKHFLRHSAKLWRSSP